MQLGDLEGRLASAGVGKVVGSAEDDGELVRMPQATIGIEQTFEQTLERAPIFEDEVVAILDLVHVQLVAETFLALFVGDERQQATHPSMDRLIDVLRREG